MVVCLSMWQLVHGFTPPSPGLTSCRLQPKPLLTLVQEKVSIEDERVTVIVSMDVGLCCVIDTVSTWEGAQLFLREANTSVQPAHPVNKELGNNTQRRRDGTSPAHSRIIYILKLHFVFLERK